MNKTSIKWTKETWNPVTGCEKISAGCKHCYAEAIATGKRGNYPFKNGFNLTLHPERLMQPTRIKEPTLIFVNSMSDLFWDQIPQLMVDAVFDVIDVTPQHTYQILTKRPERMLEQSLRRPFPKNVWAGVTIENQDAVWRLDYLRLTNTQTRFLSCEPLLSPLVLDWKDVDWVITGGESGPHLYDPAICAKRGLVEKVGGFWRPRTDRMDWIRQIRDGCHKAGTAFYHKQWGGPSYNKEYNWLDGQQWEQFPVSKTSVPVAATPATAAPVAPVPVIPAAPIDRFNMGGGSAEQLLLASILKP